MAIQNGNLIAALINIKLIFHLIDLLE